MRSKKIRFSFCLPVLAVVFFLCFVLFGRDCACVRAYVCEFNALIVVIVVSDCLLLLVLIFCCFFVVYLIFVTLCCVLLLFCCFVLLFATV